VEVSVIPTGKQLDKYKPPVEISHSFLPGRYQGDIRKQLDK